MATGFPQRVWHSDKIAYNGGRAFETLVTIVRSRQVDGSPIINQMIDVRDRYNGPSMDYVLPWVDRSDRRDADQYTPLLMAEAIDGYAVRANSVDPAGYSPAMHHGVQKGTGSRDWARKRVHGVNKVMRGSRYRLGRGRLYRQLSAYASCCAIAYPDDETEMPRIEVRDALTAYPDLRAAEDFRSPEDIAFITGRSAEWLRRVYPESQVERGGPIPSESGTTELLWDVVEWIDSDIISIGILGARETRYGQSQYATAQEASNWMELRRWPNKAGRFPGMLPSRVTLDTILSQAMNVVGHIDVMAKLQLLDVIQSERGIMPDMYIVGADGRPPRIMNDGGEWQDGRTGKINQVLNAGAIGTLANQPDPLSRSTVDRMERNINKSMGVTASMSGEPGSNALRSGAGQNALVDIAIDPRLYEMHTIFEEWEPDLAAGVLATYKGYYGGKTYSLYTGSKASGSTVEFKPSDHCETYEYEVAYPIPGADVIQTNVILTQMHGAEFASKRTVRRKHPWVDGDGEEEQAFFDEEWSEQAVRKMLEQRISTGQAPMMLLVFFEQARRSDPAGDSITALEAANKKLQEEQAKMAEQADPEQGQALPPGAMPGADAGPGGAAQQLPPSESAIGPTPDQQGVKKLFNAIAAGNQNVGPR
ncbi:MAG: hypothetical protein ACPHCN_16740 [Mycobacterium sp.]